MESPRAAAALLASPALIDDHGPMSDEVKNPGGPEKQRGLLRPGEIERAVGYKSKTGFRPRLGVGGPNLDPDPPALKLLSLPGHRADGEASSAHSERPKALTASPSAVDSSAPRILERQEIAPGLLRLRVERPAGFEFRAGQHVKFGVPGNLPSYTLASDPDEPHLEFFIELQSGGRLSDRLRSIGEGARTAIGPAGKGSFVIDPSVPNHVFVATVTGIAPFVSILREQARHGFPAGRFIVLHGASYVPEFGYADELTELAAAHPDRLEYLPTVSRPQDSRNRGWSGATGRVDALLAEALRRRGLTANATAVYACGNSGMIRNVRATAARHGLPFRSEAFD